ncbi:exonuclease mut-7 homolog isoform X6 [Macaca fascicularis]|uniref:exonuclease mut-7 homolog isoform X6 n=1 Tax=Macaca fascicularis TaxID=9541 RepID=UPI003D15A255
MGPWLCLSTELTLPAQARTPSCSCRPCRPCGPRGSGSSSRRKPGGGLLPWTTPWRGFWTCWRAAGAGGERAPPWRPGSPASCSAGYRHSHARALPSLRLKQLQARAIRVLTESPPSLVAPLTSIFQLQDADRSCLLVHVHRLHQEGRFREAVMLGTTLKLQPELDVEKMSVPLLLQDKVALVERYVAGFPDLQRRLLALMDSWCQPGFDIKDVARQYPEVTSLSLEKLSPKVLSRQVLRLQERYGVAPALCPNAAMWQRLAALRHLCHKRFVEKSLSQENWADHVRGLVGQSPWLQEQLSQLLVSHGDPVMAARCAMGLSLPEERLPAAVAVELRQLSLQGRAAEADSRLEVKDVKDRYYQLPIPRENIHLLASWEDLTRYEGALLQPHQVVGVDLEWTPVFVAGGRPRPSLLQVAVEGRVFLLDVLALSQPPTGQGAQAFSRLVAQLLSDPSITKLGYGMVGDLQKLGASCPALAHVEKQILGGVDLLLVHRQMRVTNMPTSGTDRAKGLRGLSLLVQQVLGTALDKTQQLSNWDRRPLCEEQLIYAAADAYCLLEVHQALCREPARFHLSEDLAGSRRPRHTERPGAQKPPGLQKASASAAPRQVPVAAVAEGAAPQVPARAFRVVCDNMLQGLARSLRCLGVDARMLGNGDDHRRAAEVARQEGRIILTSGQPFHKLRAQVGAGRCLSVDCSLKAQQQAKAVLKHFNVRVTHADIFSRCQAGPSHPGPRAGRGSQALAAHAAPTGSHRGLLLDSAPSSSALPSPGPSPHSAVRRPLQPGAASISPWPARPQLRCRFLQEVPQSMAGPSPLLERVFGPCLPDTGSYEGRPRAAWGGFRACHLLPGPAPLVGTGTPGARGLTPFCGRGAESPSDPVVPGKEEVSAPPRAPATLDGRAGGVPQAGAGRPRAGGRLLLNLRRAP